MNELIVKQIAECVELKRQGYKRAEIAGALGIPESLVKTRLGQVNTAIMQGLLPSPSDSPDRAQLIETELDRRDTTRERKDARNLITREVILESAVDLLRTEIGTSHAAIMAKIKSLQVKLPKAADEVARQVVSDLHHCRLDNGVDESTTAGALWTYGAHATNLLNRQRKHASVNTLYLSILGDILHGVANYQYQDRETTGNSSYQIAKTAKLLIEYISAQAAFYDTIIVECVAGNHGRKSQQQNVINDNLELDMYRIIEAAFFHVKSVQFIIADTDFKLISNAMGYKYLLMHGNTIKAGNPQGITDAIKRYEDIMPSFNSAIMGHWHRLLRLPLPRRHKELIERSVLVNGTASIDDTFLESFGSAPSLSWWFLFNNAERITATHDINLYEPGG